MSNSVTIDGVEHDLEALTQAQRRKVIALQILEERIRSSERDAAAMREAHEDILVRLRESLGTPEKRGLIERFLR